MKLKSYISAILPVCAVMAACTSEAPEPELTVTVDRTTVGVGEPVTLTITHALDGLAVYNGEEGHDWYKSATYTLAGMTDQQLQDQVYRPMDPDVRPLDYDFSDATPGATVIGDGAIELLNANTKENLIAAGEGAVVFDETVGHNVLRITSTHPDWWYQALRVNLGTKLGSNRTLTLTMRFDKDVLEDVYTGEQHPELPTFCAVIRLAGKPEGEDRVVFSDNTVWDIYWAPSLSSAEYSVDLSRIIPEWQTGTGLKMETLEYAQILFTATGSVGYVGDFYVEKVRFGDYDYRPWDTGEAVNLGAGPGTVTYTHSYSAPGEYEMVVVGTTTSMKGFVNGGYRDNMGDKISADEYRYGHVQRSVKVTVK